MITGSRVGGLVAREWANPMARSGLYLLANTGLTGFFGVIYWIIAARMYPQAAVGRGGALVSAATLLSGVGQLNLSGMLMRFLPGARARSRQLVLLTYAAACGTSLLLTAVAGVGVYLLTPHTSVLRMSPAVAVLFAASVASAVVFTLQDSILISLRRSGFVPVENGSFGVAKIVLLIAFAPLATWSAIFASWMLPLVATIPIINWFLFRRFLPRQPSPGPPRSVASDTKRGVIHFVIGDASAGIFTQTWTYLLPVLVTVALGARVNALFYIAFLFASTLDLIASNFAVPLVVEGARSPEALLSLVGVVLRRVYLVLLPLAAAFIFFAPVILRLYGHKYVPAAPCLRLLTLACLPKAFSSVFAGACRVRRQTYLSAGLQGIACVTIIGGVLIESHAGLVAVAVVVLGTQLVVAMLAAIKLVLWRRDNAYDTSQKTTRVESLTSTPRDL